ncbi:MAG: hypothetical protein D6688_14540 [Alphaproteobacteria bacterium]|nr:MAG: hypothetical protein D6688_14540 [Alphaproteobacteria bacterium]
MRHALSLAALVQCLTRMLWRLARRNQRWRIYDTFLVAENRWRAQRYGINEGLVDFGRRQIVPMPELVEELIALVAEDAEALDCTAEIEGLRDIIRTGTSADRQRRAFQAAIDAGADRADAHRAVVEMLIGEFLEDL